MNVFAIVQGVILAAVLVFCLASAARKLLPQTTKRLFGRLSAALDQPGRARLLRALGHRLQPLDAKSGGCGSGDGCGSCGGCASTPYEGTSDPHVQPLHFKSPGSHGLR